MAAKSRGRAWLPGYLLISAAILIITANSTPSQVRQASPKYGDHERAEFENRAKAANKSGDNLVQVTVKITSLSFARDLASPRTRAFKKLAFKLTEEVERLYRQRDISLHSEIESFRRTRDDKLLVVFVLTATVHNSTLKLERVFKSDIIQRRHLGRHNVTTELFSFTLLGGCCQPELHLSFDYYSGGNQLYDDSGQDNNAVIRKGENIALNGGRCRNALSLRFGGGEVSFHNNRLVQSTSSLTIAVWVKLYKVAGSQPIIQIAGNNSETTLEVSEGKVKWFYNTNDKTIEEYNIHMTRDIPAQYWTHIVAVYSANDNAAKLYIDGTLREVSELSREGNSKRPEFDGKLLIGRYSSVVKVESMNGLIDELYVYYCAVPEPTARKLFQQCIVVGSCAPAGKVTFSILLKILSKNYTATLDTSDSESYRSLAAVVIGEISKLFSTIPGKQSVKITDFRPTEKGLFADIELESVGNSDQGLIQSTFVNSLKSGYIGALQVDSKESVASVKDLKSSCRANEVRCGDGKCIVSSFVCDGERDCDDGSDEATCATMSPCTADELKCRNGKCVKRIWFCDGEDDCEDGTDELTCATPSADAKCGRDQFQCNNSMQQGQSQQCIARSFRCDGENDCDDGSDEQGCVPIAILKPPLARVTAHVGKTAQCTCAATGVPEPTITWLYNDLPLKKGERLTVVSKGGRGSLSIRNIQKSDEGRYTCEASNNMLQRVTARPDCRVVVRGPGDYCTGSTFNANSTSVEDCLPCYCMGRSNECRSSQLYINQLKSTFNYASSKSGFLLVQSNGDEATMSSYRVDLVAQELIARNVSSEGVYFWKLPSQYGGNKLTSYGGKIRYTIKYAPEFNRIDAKFTRSAVKPKTRDGYFDIIIAGGGIPEGPSDHVGQIDPDLSEPALPTEFTDQYVSAKPTERTTDHKLIERNKREADNGEPTTFTRPSEDAAVVSSTAAPEILSPSVTPSTVEKPTTKNKITRVNTTARIYIPPSKCKDAPGCGLVAFPWRCFRYPKFMSKYCPRACKFCNTTDEAGVSTQATTDRIGFPVAPGCKDFRPFCAFYVSPVYCRTHYDFVMEHCPKSCNMCLPLENGQPTKSTPLGRTPTASEYDCVDTRDDCHTFATEKYCKNHAPFMRRHCPRTCNFCVDSANATVSTSRLSGRSTASGGINVSTSQWSGQPTTLVGVAGSTSEIQRTIHTTQAATRNKTTSAASTKRPTTTTISNTEDVSVSRSSPESRHTISTPRLSTSDPDTTAISKVQPTTKPSPATVNLTTFKPLLERTTTTPTQVANDSSSKPTSTKRPTSRSSSGADSFSTTLPTPEVVQTNPQNGSISTTTDALPIGTAVTSNMPTPTTIPVSADCKDLRPTGCRIIANPRYCKRNKAFAMRVCAKTCKLCRSIVTDTPKRTTDSPTRPTIVFKDCKDLRPFGCRRVANPTYCKRNRFFARRVCPKSCGFCRMYYLNPMRRDNVV